MSGLGEISEYVNQLSFDLKAELLVALLTEQSVDQGEIMAAFDGQLKRVWSRDIAWSIVDRLETGDNMLSLHLNRDGIYDSIPEALFHSNLGNEGQSGKEMARDSAKLRDEEMEARMFFQPFENEIFLHRVQLADMENQLFRNIYVEYIMGIIPDFWRVDNDLPENYIAGLKKLLPLVNRITGDLSLTAQCLEFILKEKVKVSTAGENTDNIPHGYSDNSAILGKGLLGVDMITGNQVNGFVNRLIFSIGPIIYPETIELLKNGSMNRFLDCFYSYFIPFELDTETKYIFGNEQSLFVLSGSNEATISHLGYNSVIQ